MCYPLPGPRCSNHVEKKQKKVTEAYNELSARIKEMEQRPGWDDPDSDYIGAKALRKARTELAELEEKGDELSKVWGTTPRGLAATAKLYREANRIGDKEMAEHFKEKWMSDKAARDRQLEAYKHKEESDAMRKEASLGNFKMAQQRTAEANAWMNRKPEETREAWMVASKSDGTIEVSLHGGISPHDARQSYINAGFDPRGVEFIRAEESVPSLNEMPHMGYEEFEQKSLRGEIKVAKNTGFTVSMTSDGHNTGQAVNGCFVNGIDEPVVVRRQDAEDNTKPALVMLPGPPRPVTHEEGIILANAANSGGQVFLKSAKGADMGMYDRRKLHGDLTRGIVKPSKPKSSQYDPDAARKQRLEGGYNEPNLDAYEGLSDGRGTPRDRREPILDLGRN